MNTKESQLTQIDLEIDEAKKSIAKRDALLRLCRMPEWKLIIDEGYLKDDAARLVLLKSATATESPEAQQRIDNSIIAVGQFYQHCRSIMATGDQAEAALADYEETRQEIEDEGDAE